MRKYVFLEDSLTYGYGIKPNDNCIYKLKNTLNFNLYIDGIYLSSKGQDLLLKTAKHYFI